MTLRRAAAYGPRTWQTLAVLRTGSRSAAIAIGGLLLPAVAFAAVAHPTAHARHAAPHAEPVQSAGKAPAHLVHETATHEKEVAGKASRRHAGKPDAADGSSAAAGKGRTQPKHTHAADDDSKAAAKTAVKPHGGRKRHQDPPIDDPQPVYRTENLRPENLRTADKRHSYGTHTQVAETRPSRKAQGEEQASTPEPPVKAVPRPAVLHAPGQIPGNVARNNARRAQQTPEKEPAHIGSGLTASDFERNTPHTAPVAEAAAGTPSAAYTTGVSHPDDDERLPMHRADAPAKQRPAPITRATPAAPVANVNAAPPVPTPPSNAPVEGFGAEVDFHTSLSKPDKPTITMPRESPAQQERDLREAADVASKPMFVPLYTREGKLIVPPPLKGSHDILVHQNQMADDAGLSRIQDDDDLARMRRTHLLVDFQESASLHVNENLPENRRSARPWAVKFANDIAHTFYARFGEPLQLNSAVRTVAYQLRLQRVNGNAAAVDGEGASPHLTGQAIDFGKRGMSAAEIAWMRSYLMPLIDAGKIDVEEEFQQACFHISVYAGYAPAPQRHPPAKTEVAEVTTRPVHHHAAVAAGAEFDDEMK